MTHPPSYHRHITPPPGKSTVLELDLVPNPMPSLDSNFKHSKSNIKAFSLESKPRSIQLGGSN